MTLKYVFGLKKKYFVLNSKYYRQNYKFTWDVIYIQRDPAKFFTLYGYLLCEFLLWGMIVCSSKHSFPFELKFCEYFILIIMMVIKNSFYKLWNFFLFLYFWDNEHMEKKLTLRCFSFYNLKGWTSKL